MLVVINNNHVDTSEYIINEFFNVFELQLILFLQHCFLNFSFDIRFESFNI